MSAPVGNRRLLALAALATAVVIGFVAASALPGAAIYYLTPTEAKERGTSAGQAARLGGQIEAGTLRYEPVTRELRFVLSDGVSRVDVIGSGAPPSLLREGAGAVVDGAFASDGTFRATQVLAKHDEVYRPPPPGATPPHRVP